SRSSSADTSIPCRFAKPAAAFSRSATGGPFTHSSGVRSRRSRTTTASRRGPTYTASGARPSAFSTTSGSCAAASRQAAAGSSSQPISSSSVGTRGLPLLEVQLRDLPREVPHPDDVRGALGDRDRAARVEQVERVRALQHLIVGRQRQLALDQPLGLGLVL